MQKQAPQLFFFSTKSIGQIARYYKRKILNFFQFGLFIDLYPHFLNLFRVNHLLAILLNNVVM